MGSSSTREPLTRERIVGAAIGLLDRDGLDALSMRHLGTALGVEAMSLYRHVPSKAALLDDVVAGLLMRLDLPEPGPDWQANVREGCRRYRALLLEHPNAVPLFATLQLTSPSSVHAAGSVMALLRAGGFDAELALLVLSTIQSYVIGFALWEVGTAPLRADPRYAMPADPVDLPSGADPYLVELLPRLVTTSCDDSFEFGVNALVAGIEALRQ